MQTQPRCWKIFQRYSVVSFVVSTCFIVVFGLGLTGVTSRAKVEVAHARTIVACLQADRTHIVIGREILASIAAYYGFSEQRIAAYNRLKNPHSLYANQRICIPSSPSDGMSSVMHPFKGHHHRLAAPLVQMKHAKHKSVERRDKPMAPDFQAVPYGPSSLPLNGSLQRGRRGIGALAVPFAMGVRISSAYPYGQCTWWAAMRYLQMHNVVVPWTMNANAGQWVDRASQYGWHVSSIPTEGSILVLGGGVQGANRAGHVAVVEQILNNGTVLASSMNWGGPPGVAITTPFHVGTGVTFVSR
ncbi:CHAP domain-containing protein [Dictyobacter vulcani]|uniref:CHAP domain-containing protein n=1 Tax=Dictyobacter vulcani TaxID=2607529 RepID=UPI0013872792|nr:CHAP domain-containing protein [Dictyobacter vulcani]